MTLSSTSVTRHQHILSLLCFSLHPHLLTRVKWSFYVCPTVRCAIYIIGFEQKLARFIELQFQLVCLGLANDVL
jgi:hypothetical protein